MELTENEINEAREIWRRWIDYKKHNQVGKMINRGLGLMSEAERGFLLKEGAICQGDQYDLVVRDREVWYCEGKDGAKTVEQELSGLIKSGNGKKIRIPWKFTTWLNAKTLSQNKYASERKTQQNIGI